MTSLAMNPTSIPPEIYALIIEYVDYHDLPNLSLVSRTLRDPSQKQLFRTLMLGNSNPDGAAKQLSILAKHPHLTRGIRNVEANVRALVPLLEANNFDNVINDGDPISFQELLRRASRLSLGLVPVLSLCADRFQSLTLYGHGGTGFISENNICDGSLATIFCEVLMIFQFPSFQRLAFGHLDPRSFNPFTEAMQHPEAERFAIFRSNIRQIKHFAMDDCTEGGNTEGFTVDYIIPLFVSFVPQMQLRSFSITRNPEFVFSLKTVGLQGMLTKIEISEAEIKNGLEQLIIRNQNLSFVRLEKVILDHSGGVEYSWAAVFDSLSKCSHLRVLEMAHLTYETYFYLWVELEYDTFWDYHDDECTEDENVLCSLALDNMNTVDINDYRVLEELYKKFDGGAGEGGKVVISPPNLPQHGDTV